MFPFLASIRYTVPRVETARPGPLEKDSVYLGECWDHQLILKF
jgi:hypothetical protein